MAKKIKVESSLVEQIFDEMFARIEGKNEFDPQTVQRLKETAQKGDLSKATQVAKAIKVEPGGDL